MKITIDVNEFIKSDVPANLVLKYLKEMSVYTKAEMAFNKNTSIEVLKELAQDELEEVRWSVASNCKTPREVLERLAKEDESERIRNSASWTISLV